MADHTSKATNMARVLAIVHIIVGFLLVCFGIADLLVEYFYTGYVCYGIWIGVWMCITGSLGIPGTRKERTNSRNAFAGVFMGFSITSAVLGGIIIIAYSVAIAYYRDDYNYYYDHNHYNDGDVEVHFTPYRSRRSEYAAEMVISALILILGIVEFVTGIWAAVCLCIMSPCTCCYSTPPQQVQMMYTANTSYGVGQFPIGEPAAGPMQAIGGTVALPNVTPGPQGSQPQFVMVPVSEGVGTKPQFVQVATSGAMTTGHQPITVPVGYPPQLVHVSAAGAMTTVNQPQQVDMNQASGHGDYSRLTNEQDPVNV